MERRSVSTSKYGRLTAAYAKHQMMVSPMQEVYVMFSSQWQANENLRFIEFPKFTLAIGVIGVQESFQGEARWITSESC